MAPRCRSRPGAASSPRLARRGPGTRRWTLESPRHGEQVGRPPHRPLGPLRSLGGPPIPGTARIGGPPNAAAVSATAGLIPSVSSASQSSSSVSWKLRPLARIRLITDSNSRSLADRPLLGRRPSPPPPPYLTARGPVAVKVAVNLAFRAICSVSNRPTGARFDLKIWSRRGDSNSRPAVYETAALPLSYVGGDGEFTNAPPGHLPAVGRLGRSVDELGGGVHHFGLNVPRTRSVRTGGRVRDRFAADAQPIRAGIHQDGVALREVSLQD